MRLGQKVKFCKYLTKLSSQEQTHILKYRTVETEPLEGYISGKRTIPFTGYTESDDERYRYFVPGHYKEVYLIACKWNGFYRVPEEWIEE
jgi:hypothetical protein